MKPAVAAIVAGLFLMAPAPARSQSPPPAELLTRPERTGFRETSRHEDVLAVLEALAARSDAIAVDTFGYSYEGRALPVARWGEGETRILVLANIHAGEVEGKEAALVLLRDLAAGLHAAWRPALTLYVAPIYNADGNERIALTNRPFQLGPIGGMGQRPNAQGLDLNRDFMKLEAPETRSLVAFLSEVDPHVVLDLHTTNGSLHGYDLTYAPPLHPDTDPAIATFIRDSLLPAVTRQLRETAGATPPGGGGVIGHLRAGGPWHTWYYGNLPDAGVDGADEPSAPRGWYSFSPEPRFGTNYIGLRNRFGILSEAYSYIPFDERIAVTVRFVEEVLDFVGDRGEAIRRLTEAADRRTVTGADLALAADFETTIASAEVMLAEVDTVPHPYTGLPMLRRRPDTRIERMPARISFRATETRPAPAAYLLPATLARAPEVLAAHGVRIDTLTTDRELDVEEFRISASIEAEEEFQGHRARTLEGEWWVDRREIPAGTLVVPMDQPLARLAFHLLEPRSTDGLVRWNVLDAALGQAKAYPILRTSEVPPPP